MKILFTKMHGIGNDYIFIDMIKNKYPLLLEDKIPKLARFLCKEHFGVGSDGVILIDSSRKADFKMRIFNKDGKEAEMCGNGIRCFAKYIYDNKMTIKNKITIETLAGIKEVEFIKNKNDIVEEYKVNMGIPKIEGIIKTGENFTILTIFNIHIKVGEVLQNHSKTSTSTSRKIQS